MNKFNWNQFVEENFQGRNGRQLLTALMMGGPAFFLMMVFIFWPFVRGIDLSRTNQTFSGKQAKDVGWDNYDQILSINYITLPEKPEIIPELLQSSTYKVVIDGENKTKFLTSPDENNVVYMLMDEDWDPEQDTYVINDVTYEIEKDYRTGEWCNAGLCFPCEVEHKATINDETGYYELQAEEHAGTCQPKDDMPDGNWLIPRLIVASVPPGWYTGTDGSLQFKWPEEPPEPFAPAEPVAPTEPEAPPADASDQELADYEAAIKEYERLKGAYDEDYANYERALENYEEKTEEYPTLLANYKQALKDLDLENWADYRVVWRFRQNESTYHAIIAKDPVFWRALSHNFYFVLIVVPNQTTLALLLAILINQKIKGVNFFRTMYFSPVVTAMAVIAVVWVFLYNPDYGLVNKIMNLLTFNLFGKPDWLNETDLAMPAIMIMSMWQGVGFQMVIFLAGLQDIPEDLYEAAQIDGAGVVQKFRFITLPMLRNTTIFVVLTTTILAFRLFDQVKVMTDGGPEGSTSTIVWYAITTAQQNFAGRAAAISVAFVLIVLAVSIVQRVFLKSESALD